MITNYISIKSVLYDLSLTIDDRYWNEQKMLQWLIHGVRQINLISMLEPRVAEIQLSFHKAVLPSDVKYITQISYSDKAYCDPCCETCPPSECSPCNSGTAPSWQALRKASSPYHSSIFLNSTIGNCDKCGGEFSIGADMVLSSNLLEGTLLVAYLGYPQTPTGETLIPDDETLKEAIFHYGLYRYWLSKYQMKEEGADSRVKFHLDMWNTLSKKAQNLNAPDLSTLENIMHIWNRLEPRTNRFDRMFTNLSHQ